MTDHRTEIVKRVMRFLEETTDPEELVSAYFDVDHDMVVQATQQTWLEARRAELESRLPTLTMPQDHIG
jgi:hypothetical protein